MACRHERLDEQAVDRLRRGVGEIESSEVYLAIPCSQEPKIGFQAWGKAGRESCASAFRGARQPVLELTARHEVAEFADNRPRKTPRTATAAGVMPGIREAWPSVSGRTCDRRWTASRDRPGPRANGKAPGIRRRPSPRPRSARACSCFR